MKRKWIKRTLSLLMVLMLAASVTACNKEGDGSTTPLGTQSNGGENAGDTGEGRWAEKDITPENAGYILMAPTKMDDKSYVFFAKASQMDANIVKYTSTDNGDSWVAEQTDWGTQSEGIINNVRILPDGTAVVVSIRLSEDMEELLGTDTFMVKDNKLTKLESLTGMSPYTMEFLNATTLFVSGSSDKGVDYYKLIDIANDKLIKDVDFTNSNSYGMLIGTALDKSDESKPRLYYTEYNEVGETLNALDINATIESGIADVTSSGGKGSTDEEGNYYFVHNGGICRVVKNGALQEQIMDDNGFQLGLSNNYCSDMTYVDNTTFFCVISGTTGDSMLLKYFWDTSAPVEISGSINVWSLYDSATIRAAVVEFKKANADIDIKYEVGMEDETAVEEDVIRALNTQLVSGSGPDVLILDGLNYENYIDKGFLSDISDAVDFESFQKNITDPFKNEDGTCYMIPSRFSVPVVMGDAGDFDNMKTLEDFKQAILTCQPRPSLDLSAEAYYEEWSPSQRYGVGVIDMNSLVDLVLKTSAPELLTDNQINHENLTQAMEFVESIGKHYGMDKYPDAPQSNAIFSSSDDYDPVSYSDGGYEYAITHHAQYGIGDLTTPAFFAEAQRDYSDDKTKSDIICQPGLSDHVYTPSSLISVTATSKNQEASKKFVAEVFSEKIQSVSYSDGNPVLKSALDASIEKHKDYVKENAYEGDMTAFYNSLQTPVIVSGNAKVLREYMVKHGNAIVKGQETLDQAVKGIEDDVKLMFEEQN